MNPKKQVVNFLQKEYPDFSEQELTTLSAAASDRNYFRAKLPNQTVVVVYNEKVEENADFIYLADLMHKEQITAPQIFQSSTDQKIISQTDVGDTSLLAWMAENPQQKEQKMREVIDQLIPLQWKLHDKIDYEKLNHHQSFDEPLMYRDLFYFKHYYLDLVGIHYKEHNLLNEFQKLIKKIAEIPFQAFMYRDLQSRNLHLHQEKIYFIDFQGGMYGPVLYDLVSLIWQAKANLSSEVKQRLKEYYIQKTENYLQIKLVQQNWREDYQYLVLIRLLQVMGAYGKLGILGGKEHFRESIDLGVENLKEIAKKDFMDQFPTIKNIVEQL